MYTENIQQIPPKIPHTSDTTIPYTFNKKKDFQCHTLSSEREKNVNKMLNFSLCEDNILINQRTAQVEHF